jgi:hypothetical protein
MAAEFKPKLEVETSTSRAFSYVNGLGHAYQFEWGGERHTPRWLL